MAARAASGSEGDITATVNYYGRAQLPRHLFSVAQGALQKRMGDPVMQFWCGVGLLLDGSIADAMREFETLRNKKEVQLAALVGLLHAHKQSRVVDQDAVDELSANISILQDDRSNPPKTLVLAANLHWLIGEHVKARELCQRAVDTGMPAALSLRGWIDLTCGRETLARNAGEFFDKCLGPDGSNQDLESLLGKSRCYERVEKFELAIDHLNKIIVGWSWFHPALSEKMRLLMAMGAWEQATETSQRIQMLEPRNVEAIFFHCLLLLAREGRVDLAQRRIRELIEAISLLEPRNARFMWHTSRALARVSGRDPVILTATLELIDRACKISPTTSEYFVELGHQQYMAGQLVAAADAYKQATKLDESNMDALHGTILIQILKGEVEDAAQQLEFLHVVHDSVGQPPDVLFLGALLEWHKSHDVDASAQKLRETIAAHLPSNDDEIKDSLAVDYLIKINPDFLLEIARRFMQHCGHDPQDPSEPPSPLLTSAVQVLQVCRKIAPGVPDCQMLLARAQFINRDFEGAQATLTGLISMNSQLAEAYILLAQVFVEIGKFRPAAQALEQALSHNFEVRESARYHLVKAKVFEKAGNMDQAVASLEAAMQLPAKPRNMSAAVDPAMLAHDRCAVMLRLASLHSATGKHQEAAKILSAANKEFHGSSESVRVLLASAQAALAKGDVQGALRMLKSIGPTSSAYTQAKVQIANIYLHHRRNSKLYIQCYIELLERNPTPQNKCLLGEAYMKIQEPEKAIEQFESAMSAASATVDPELASKIGQALVSTHDFDAAIRYYQRACEQQPNRANLRIQLAELYMKLRRFQEASTTVSSALKTVEGSEEIQAQMMQTKLLLLQAEIFKRAEQTSNAVEVLQRARMQQNGVLAKLRGEQADIVRQQRSVAANICCELGEYFEKQHQVDRATEFYTEAMKHDDKHSRSILSLAKLYLDKGDLQEAQNYCTTLKNQSSSEEAIMMLADIMFRKNEPEAAIHHFQQLLEQKPNHWAALSRLLTLLYRAGKITDGPRFLKQAERSSAKAVNEAGYHFCKGLYCRYTNDPHEAVKEFNHARRDGEWGQKALTNMIEVYLNPDNDTLTEEVPDKSPPANQEAIAMAAKFRQELTGVSHEKIMVYEGFEMLFAKQKTQVERAINKFTEVLKDNQNSVPALLGMSYASLMQKQATKARNFLKRIASSPYTSDEAEEFERAYLLLADVYIQNSKNEEATKLCDLCLMKNQSCAKAYEYRGMICEKEQNFIEAAQAYEGAWKHSNENSPVVGFKLAFNYLKAKRYVEAIDVCHKVLKKDPEYPKIRKEILEKARTMLRV